MNRRTMLKLPAFLAAFFAPALGIARTEPSLERQIPIDRLYRHRYDGEAALDPAYQMAFVERAYMLSVRDFGQIGAKDEMYDIEIVSGRRWRVYDELQDDIAAPPYYLWCRCSITISEAAIKDHALLQRLTRDARGLLPHTYI